MNIGTVMLCQNPLVVRGIRTRLRPPAALSWAAVTLVASTFIYIFFSENLNQHSNMTPAEASREAILPLLIMQGIILMVLGTGAVAGGMARERTYRLLDYQRLTPMSPAAKIIGLLIGLPIREYFMFAISMPFVFYAAWKGGMPFGSLIQFYAVFITSTMVYHMTGLAAGMVVGKPWQAGTLSQGLVVLLYLLLPQVSNFGFTFFEFLTARPVFYGMVNDYLLPDSVSEEVRQVLNDPRYSEVAFFGVRLSPVLFSFAVQGYALLSLFVIAHRKWQSEARLPFSKGFALLFFAIAQLFLIGSVQPLLASDELFNMLVENYIKNDPLRDSERTLVFAIFVINLSVSGCMAILTVYLCTPNGHQSVAGVRQLLRAGEQRLAWTSDAASGIPVSVACWLMSCLGFIVVYQSAVEAGRVGVVNTRMELLMMMVFFLAVLLTVQQVIEQFSERVFVMALFAFWLVPVLAGIIIGSAFNQPVAGVYTMIPFPFIELYFNAGLLMSDERVGIPDDLRLFFMVDEARPIVLISVCLYLASAITLLLLARRRWQRIRVAAGGAVASAVPLGACKHGQAASQTPVPALVRAVEPPSRP